MESRHCGQDRRIFFCPVHNAKIPCSLQALGIRCIRKVEQWMDTRNNIKQSSQVPMPYLIANSLPVLESFI